MSPLKQSKNLAARMGRWSASHWKTAVFGWLAFVVASVFIGMQVGTRFIDERDANVGESRTADQIIARPASPSTTNGESIEKQSEMVLLQSKTLTVEGSGLPRRDRGRRQDRSRRSRRCTKLDSPLVAGHSDLISKDGHSAMVEFTPKGTYEEAVLYIDTIVAAVDKVETRHPGFTVDSVGALDRQGARRGDQGRPRKGGADLDPAHDHHPDVRARIAGRRA